MAGNGNDRNRPPRDDTPVTGRHGPLARSGADPSTRLIFARLDELRHHQRGQGEDLRQLRREQGEHRDEVRESLRALDDRLGRVERGSHPPPSRREIVQRWVIRVGGAVLAFVATAGLTVGGWYLARVSERMDQIPVLIGKVEDALEGVEDAEQKARNTATEAGQLKVWIETVVDEQRDRDGRQDQRLDRLDRRIHH